MPKGGPAITFQSADWTVISHRHGGAFIDDTQLGCTIDLHSSVEHSTTGGQTLLMRQLKQIGH